MRRVVSLYLPTWPTDRRRRLEGAPPRDEPMVTTMQDGPRRIVASADRTARELGLSAGMTITQAQALVPGLHIAEATIEADNEGLTRLALWCTGYSPLVTPDAPDGVFIDIAGSAHLFKGEAALIEGMLHRLHGSGFRARASVADTPGCAHAVARYGKQAVVAPGETAGALAGLPIAALRLPADTIAALSRVGVDRIGQLAQMPRGPVKLRYGADVLMRLDQALGAMGEPLVALRPPDIPRSERRFAEPLLDADNLGQVAADLCEDLCLDLERRGVGARRLDLAFLRVDGCHQAVRIGTSQPVRDPIRLAKLLKERLVLIDPGFGIDEAWLTASWIEALTERQTIGRHVSDEVLAADDVGALVDTLSVRLGDRRVYRAAPVESEIPERSVKRVPALTKSSGTDWPKDLPRPSKLLSPPEPVNALAQVPDYPPAMFIWNRRQHRIARADGPERIRGDWWVNEAEATTVRDYYRVETAAGERFWLFRDGARWFLHGLGDA